MHPDCDQGKLKKMIDDCADHNEAELPKACKDMMQDKRHDKEDICKVSRTS